MLRRNLGLKLLSLVLAVILWAYALARTSPTAEVTVMVPVRAEDLVPHYSYTVVPDRVAARLRGPRDRIAALERDHAGLLAVTSAKGFEPGEHQVALSQPELPPGIRVVYLEPGTVRLRVEHLLERKFHLVLRAQGAPPPGYGLSDLKVVPPEVRVRGKDAEVERIAAAGVSPDLEMLAARGVVGARVDFYNGQGDQITPALAEVDPPLVSVYAGAMQVSSKVVPVQVDVQYPPDSGWRVQSVEVRPSTVTLVGSPKILGTVETLQASVVVDEARPLVAEAVTLMPPQGLQLKGAQKARVRVRMAPATP